MPRNDKPRKAGCTIAKQRMKRITKVQVTKLLRTVMEKEEGAASATAGTATSEDFHNEFYNTGRMGRRNALPDILGNHAATTTADLPAALDALSTQDNSANLQHGTSSLNQPTTSSTPMNNSSSSSKS